MSNKKSNYQNIIDEIKEKIQNTTPETNEGAEKLKQVYKVLNESKTPILDLKPFVTGAEKISGDDIALNDVVKFCKNKIGGDNQSLNFVLNLIKEEHFKELTRLNHPSPNSTIKEFKKYLEGDAVDSEIEEAIKNGVFDSMKSNLLKEMKSVLEYKAPRIDNVLNESDAKFDSFLMPNLMKYSPIGIQTEDLKTQKTVLLCESSAIQFDGQNFSTVNPKDLAIDSDSRKMMNAITTLKYDARNKRFNLNESWDFSASIDTNGIFRIADKEVAPEHVEALLFESINVYEKDKFKYPNFNKSRYLHEVDNIKCLMENAHILINFDVIECVKNLNENSYVLFDVRKNTKPTILSSSKSPLTQMFESFSEMKKECDSILKMPCKLFESEIKIEGEKLASRESDLNALFTEQKELNESISNVRNLKKLADENSPALDRLCEQEKDLTILLDANLSNINSLKNNFKLY